MPSIQDFIIQQTSISHAGVKNTLQLLAEDCTIPFISRYRKERTGNLDEVQIGEIVKLKEQFETLEKRKGTILKALEDQNALTPDLQKQIENTQDATTLEDLYLPFKKKRKTKADTARNNGLEPLAKIIMSQPSGMNAQKLTETASKYAKKEVKSSEEALEGARYIIAEWVNERTDVRNALRRELERNAVLTTKVIKAQKEEEKAQKYRDYFKWEEALRNCPSHRFLAILRAEKEGFIRVKITIDEERALEHINRKVIKSPSACAEQISMAVEDGYKRLLFPALSNEVLNSAKEKADNEAILVFAKNLKQLLLGAPLGQKRILAIDPGFRTGCKVVCLDAQGGLQHNETIYPHPPKKDIKGASKKISFLVEAYKIDAIAIGNGTASRETEHFIRKIPFKTDLQVFVVSEAGASIYSASPIARAEFPNYDVTVRGAVSIGRRLADPLAELVKIDAKSIGVGQYQHDVDQVKLQSELDRVVETCVNAVGVNINTASAPLLSYVSGIGDKLAENIVAHREENGAFASRKEILNVARLGAKAFEQSAGFLRIRDGKNPLDNSAVHPESYPIVEKMAKNAHKSVAELIGNTSELSDINLEKYETESVGLLTLKDIINELEKPGLDIRAEAKVFTFNQNIKTIEDLEKGQLLPGIVNNVTNFGAFVDIGIKESGLIHISNLAEGFVSDVSAHVALHEQVVVEVLDVDIPRKRIQLKKSKIPLTPKGGK
ncbi:Tex family protein [Flavimarina sp. Hel_I_48]|uniref:Tex family protein n=1 Tax=Flavimarina sp. Hel_I_48 TaxID=1392488 RepID=UPI0004DF014E|nr:Tex family protein [Flavimarina sp. Hel_I_48]